MAIPMIERENEYKFRNQFKDEKGQAHFPDTKLNPGQMDKVKLGKPSGYYPKCGAKS